jgi:NTP pyrophosphatase (non-canonical NTP hydrolase)
MLKSEHGNMEKYQMEINREMEINRLNQIRQWAHDRNLIMGGSKQAQMLKGMEEFGETAAAVARGNTEAVKDGIGDMVVVLTILAAQHDLAIEDCIEAAWHEIKDRKGVMRNGIFIKEADL